MESVQTFVTDVINDNYWKIIPFLLIAAGVYFAVRTLVVQIRMIPDMFRAVAEKQDTPESHTDEQGISAFKAFTISAASRVGTGNVAGVAVAITLGGPGAVFWMWMIALLGGATAFVESTLAQLWKTKTADGTYRGGPAYYMTRGINARWLAVIFGVAITITYGFVYNSIQANSIVEATGASFDSSTMTFKVVVGLILAAVTGVIIFGGVHRIANFTQIIVPVMALAYLAIGILVLLLNVEKIPGMFASILEHALGFKEIAGATVGAAFMNGMRRGLFSNEAGQGSAPNAAGTANVSHPVKQGLVQTLGVYFDTILVCSITAFIILLGNPTFGDNVQGATLTQSALAGEVGAWGTHFVTVILFFLAFSSVIGNTFLAQSNIEYFTNSKAVMTTFRIIVMACVFGGAIGPLPLVWALGDTFAATMVVINLIAIIPLGGVAVKLLKNYNQQKAQGLDPVFHRDMLPELKNVECWDGSDPVTRRDHQIVREV
ncbi:alanine/glycine:cation symporter family protein [Corynebacterium silvaticum]|uniref:Alanine/glycine:cation symporter family protein n=1 Tax=Corynebacterium silvaticum TaxID=2320431 RepID=A0A7Y4LFV6_9CORY|nr:alanine/glycine:cation symporter family protein [Corynebacterium silvaticum]ARU46410.1 alanine/glycine:cation symporter family protein [Corynebacterium silvaticum]MBH5299551.1 alanine:cation symporter family protein [Corynebacterium silvaticum]NOM64130.1 alanine:cation symporter family protein [Corynebacterium silvaticum]NON69335.1 alanine:cation symporter family protein [Corynebacterium silvaticum]TFA93979.1 alanine:cation symporter family protein [Corynebacterium silvaticum]